MSCIYKAELARACKYSRYRASTSTSSPACASTRANVQVLYFNGCRCKYKEATCKYTTEAAAEPVLAKPLSKKNKMQEFEDVVQLRDRVGRKYKYSR